ncbi:MAG: hypothetical protein QG661_3252 [Actinomycetota bacterium]|nr:hypothetical protein [Actinomycetota bacterium]
MRTPLVIGMAAVLAGTVAVTPASAETGLMYMEPVASGVTMKALATAGDVIGGVMWQGVPDGIGVLRDGDDLTVFINHELSATNAVASTIARANGAATASTVSALNLDTASMSVTAARDLLSTVSWYNYATGSYGSTPSAPAGAAAKDEFGSPNHTKALNRFCSSHMVQPGDLAYTVTDAKGRSVTYGHTGPAYFTGEEGGDESRAFGMDNAGNLVQLPRLGLAAWENFLVAPKSGKRTVVMGNEDGSATDSQLWMYVGEKTTEGDWVTRAGLSNGQLYVMSINGIANDNVFRATVAKGSASQVSFNAIDHTVNGVQQNASARALGSELARVEDGAFDPNNPNDYYFVTTESNKDPKATAPNPATPAVSRDGGALWRLRFLDITNPMAGATLTMLLDGSEVPYLSKPDNIDVDLAGNVLIQEDPGNNDHIARVVSYRISDGKLVTVAKFVDQYFKPGSPTLITRDEESSGITDVSEFLRKGESDKASYYVLDAQVHASTLASRPDLAGSSAATKAALAQAIEGGQLYLMTVPDWSKAYG